MKIKERYTKIYVVVVTEEDGKELYLQGYKKEEDAIAYCNDINNIYGYSRYWYDTILVYNSYL